MFHYVCQEYFQGRSSGITEFSIAVHALGRRGDFDSGTDTITRVTAHHLRKRLATVYSQTGDTAAVRISFPPGQYAPQFSRVTSPEPTLGAADGSSSEPGTSQGVSAPAPWWRLWLAMLIGCLVVLGALLGWWRSHRAKLPMPTAEIASSADTYHLIVGSNRNPFRDHDGVLWQPTRFCKGDSVAASRPSVILGGSAIHEAGLRGFIQCSIPTGPGFHDLRLIFSDSTDLASSSAGVTITLNSFERATVDVPDISRGTHAPVVWVHSGTTASPDGHINLDISSQVSMLNAIEVIPTTSAKIAPLRISMTKNSILATDKTQWTSDRFYVGGRLSLLEESTPPKLFDSFRVGTFSYRVPVAAAETYTVNLYSASHDLATGAVLDFQEAPVAASSMSRSMEEWRSRTSTHSLKMAQEWLGNPFPMLGPSLPA